MYVSALAMSFHGMIAMPTDLNQPPVLNEMRFGARLAKFVAGATTLARCSRRFVATPTRGARPPRRRARVWRKR